MDSPRTPNNQPQIQRQPSPLPKKTHLYNVDSSILYDNDLKDVVEEELDNMGVKSGENIRTPDNKLFVMNTDGTITGVAQGKQTKNKIKKRKSNRRTKKQRRQTKKTRKLKSKTKKLKRYRK